MSASAITSGSEYFRPAILDRILKAGHKVIDASAGTGKTFTIEHVVVELLLTGAARIDQILVVTLPKRPLRSCARESARPSKTSFPAAAPRTLALRIAGPWATTTANG